MNRNKRWILVATALLVLFLSTETKARGQAASGDVAATPAGPASSSTPVSGNEGSQGKPEAEKQRAEAQQQAQDTLDKDAVAALDETRKAAKAIADGKNDEAISAIERATGKIAILVARKPETGFVPVDTEITTIDIAPRDANALSDIVKKAEKALDDKDYPLARILLEGLTSEVRVRTYHLPLATYPAALREAARLLDQKKAKEASAVLSTALNTLVVIDRGIPLPLAAAQTAINEAQGKRDSDKTESRRLLASAKAELERAKLLGYAGNDAEYTALSRAISDLEKQLQGDDNTTSAFSKLKEKMDAFFKRLSEAVKRA